MQTKKGIERSWPLPMFIGKISVWFGQSVCMHILKTLRNSCNSYLYLLSLLVELEIFILIRGCRIEKHI